MNQTDLFVPPAAEGLPLAALDSATEGADRLDAAALTPTGRNFLAHALVQLARDGWLRPEPGEGFEPVAERETPEPEPASAVLPEPTADFDGCNRRCRLKDAHTLVWGECEHAPEPEPTVSLSRPYTGPDGVPGIAFDRYTVPQLAELIERALRAAPFHELRADDYANGPLLITGYLKDLARSAARAIVHRNDGPAAASAVVHPTAGRAESRKAAAEALFEHWDVHGNDADLADDFDCCADAVLAVLGEQADRAAVLSDHERAMLSFALEMAQEEIYARSLEFTDNDRAALDSLRRLAVEAHDTGTQQQPARGDQFEAWLKTQRDLCFGHASSWGAVDGLLDQYRLHADTGTPLGEHVCEGRAVGDCEHMEQPAEEPRCDAGFVFGGRCVKPAGHQPPHVTAPVTQQAAAVCTTPPCQHPGDCEHGCRAAADELVRLGQEMTKARHTGGNAEDCPACCAQGIATISYPWECPGPDTTAADGEETPFGADGCLCKPWTTEQGVRRFLKPDESINRISGWCVVSACPHHTPTA